MSIEELSAEVTRLSLANDELRARHASATEYIRNKINQLLTVMGTSPLRPEELDDKTLIAIDPIGIISGSFAQVLEHLHETNKSLEFARDEIQAIFDAAGMGILVIDREMNVLSFNRQLEIYFFSGRDMTQKALCHELICGFDTPRHSCPFMAIFETGSSVRQSRWILKHRYYDVVGTPIGNRAEGISQIVLVYMDITDRILAEEALRASEEKYRDLFENANDMIQSVGPDGSFLYVNRAWTETLGYAPSEVAGLTIFDIIHPDCSDCSTEVKSVVFGEINGRIETRFITKGRKELIVEGNISAVYTDGKLAGTRGIFRDITERRKIEERLLNAEKIEALGVLAGGIAHDFNNLLSAIMGNIDLAMLSAKPESPQRRFLESAEKAAFRSRDLTTQLLTFSRGGAPIRKASSVTELIHDSAGFALRGSKCRAEFSMAPDLQKADIDEGQISQVINNLVLNAIQAMPEGGVVRIAADNFTPGMLHAGVLMRDAYVRITISDEGQGIAPEYLPRIFEPYFTTKESGSGLGLATSYSIVRRHGGIIDVESMRGRGTTMRVYLPAAEAGADQPLSQERPNEPARRGKILIMDDEEMVLMSATAMLEEMGYEVETARHGKEAIGKYEAALKEHQKFDAVIFDLTIPGAMGGQETIKKLLEIDPDAKAIVSSGYSSDAVMANYSAHGFAGVLAKPYRHRDLAAALQKLFLEAQ